MYKLRKSIFSAQRINLFLIFLDRRMQFTTDSNILHLQHKQLKYQLQKANNILNHIPLFRQVNPSKQPGGSLREGAPVKVNPHQIQLLKRETHPPSPLPPHHNMHPPPPSHPTLIPHSFLQPENKKARTT